MLTASLVQPCRAVTLLTYVCNGRSRFGYAEDGNQKQVPPLGLKPSVGMTGWKKVRRAPLTTGNSWFRRSGRANQKQVLDSSVAVATSSLGIARVVRAFRPALSRIDENRL